ncbi:secretion-regulating guanine nucleotide exchange factor isoform X2 [Topomyia yanbarensis]|nr:secretion-regulating guanine nucleotide exchange factor isoform X2 [Topomyia yanbarensis]
MCENPQLVESLPFDAESIRTISAGGGHTLICTDDGRLFSSGWNNRGQLGLGHTNDVCRFTFVGEYGFKTVACGWDVSGGINTQGELYLWGSNLWWQIADKNAKFYSTPTKLELPAGDKARKVCFGLRHTCVLTEDGRLLLLGKSKLLHYETLDRIDLGGIEFFALKFPEKVADVVSGENHLVIRLERGTIVCKGDDKFGQCLKGTDVNVGKLQVVKLQSGWSHSGYLTSNGTVYLWGRNNYGQLGVAVDTSRDGPTLLDVESNVRDFCLGSQHGVALADDGVYSWGWNEHGNCGTGNNENVWTPTRIKQMRRAEVVASGAAFCFVLQKR